MEKSPFSMRLISLRKANRMTQEELARELDLNRSTYTCYETGTSMPSIATLTAIADKFDVSVDYLLGRADKLRGECMEGVLSVGEEMQIVEMYRRLNRERREIVVALMRQF